MNGNLFVGKRGIFTGDVSINTNANVGGILTTNSMQGSTTSTQIDIATSQVSGNLNIGTASSRAGIINIGNGPTSNGSILIGNNSGARQIIIGSTSGGSSTTYAGDTLNLLGGSVGAGAAINLGNTSTNGNINIGANGTLSSITPINIAVSTAHTGLISIGTGDGRAGGISIGTGTGIKTLAIGGGNTTLNFTGNDTTITSTRLLLSGDVSLNRNMSLISQTRNMSLAVNKDISSSFALDVSGATIFRGPTTLIGEVSLNQNFNVTGRAMFGAPPTNAAFEVDVSGQMRIYEPTGSKAGIATGSLVLEHNDASGSSSIVFRSKNNAASDYAYIQNE
jgi:hypothetical protein